MVGTWFPKLQNGRCLHTTQEYLHKTVQIIIPYINNFWNPGFICNDKNTAIISNTRSDSQINDAAKHIVAGNTRISFWG